jgi:hypothetical protein
MNKNERLDDHQKFKQMAALAQRGALSDFERMELNRHLGVCHSCQEAYEEYALISVEGMPFLVATFDNSDASEDWDNRPVRNKLMARIQDEETSSEPFSVAGTKAEVLSMRRVLPKKMAAQWAGIGVAACLLIGVGAYHLGGLAHDIAEQNPPAPFRRNFNPESGKKVADEIAAKTTQLSRLQRQASADQFEVTRLRDALHAAETRSVALSAAKAEREEEFRRVSEQRDKLAAQLRDAEQAAQVVQAELNTLRAEHDRVLLHTTSLESKIDELGASMRDQERRLKDDEQYLSSDRDIRELMGARKLYIADVFDVDSGSRTRKPFGRVFYTQNKSLIFYAFDLDHEPGVKNASAFQVWGQRDAESGEKNRAMNLGILYMDSETNRRWVLRLDDPKQLAEIDAVFVTVEPHGGSHKPTGKPFLYALLRKEANHP